MCEPGNTGKAQRDMFQNKSLPLYRGFQLHYLYYIIYKKTKLLVLPLTTNTFFKTNFLHFKTPPLKKKIVHILISVFKLPWKSETIWELWEPEQIGLN